MFAGEGTPERTNRRFHFVSEGQPAVRLSTAFDSVTLYGADPDRRPDIWVRLVTVVFRCVAWTMQKDFIQVLTCAPSSSVSMTINGPPHDPGLFFNAAIDAEVESRLEGAWTMGSH